MGNPNPLFRFRFGFAFVLSLSFAAATTSTSASSHFNFNPPPVPPPSLSFPRRSQSRCSSSSAAATPKPPNFKATASDLLSLLGTPQQSSSVNAQEAQQLCSCFKFLVPFSPPSHSPTRRSLHSKSNLAASGRCKAEDNELIWWPPAPVMELARLAVDSGADPDVVHRALDPTIIPVPDVEGSKKDRCELTRTPYGRRFINEELNSYLEFVFDMIVDRGPSVGLNVSLNRYDLFHGHLFLARDTGRIGILFHAKEYPAYQKEEFPYNLGFCQKGSNVKYDESMDLRNILWLAPLASNSTNDWLAPGVLVVLDAHPGGIIYKDLIPDYVNFARTLYEDDFGNVAVDVNYLNVGGSVPEYQIFIC